MALAYLEFQEDREVRRPVTKVTRAEHHHRLISQLQKGDWDHSRYLDNVVMFTWQDLMIKGLHIPCSIMRCDVFDWSA